MTLQFALCNLHFEMLYSRRNAASPNKVFTLRFACTSGNRLPRLREYKTLGFFSEPEIEMRTIKITALLQEKIFSVSA